MIGTPGAAFWKCCMAARPSMPGRRTSSMITSGRVVAGRGEALFGRDGGRGRMAQLLGQLGQPPADALFVVNDEEVGHDGAVPGTPLILLRGTDCSGPAVAFRSAKAARFAERKATIRASFAEQRQQCNNYSFADPKTRNRPRESTRPNVAKLRKNFSPADWLFSGWNWEAKTLSRQIIEQNGLP